MTYYVNKKEGVLYTHTYPLKCDNGGLPPKGDHGAKEGLRCQENRGPGFGFGQFS